MVHALTCALVTSGSLHNEIWLTAAFETLHGQAKLTLIPQCTLSTELLSAAIYIAVYVTPVHTYFLLCGSTSWLDTPQH